MPRKKPSGQSEKDAKTIARLNAGRAAFQAASGDRSKEMTLAEDFYAGDQWPEKAITALDAVNAPHLTINELASHIDAVAGQETTRRFATRYLPRSTREIVATMAECWNVTSAAVLAACDAEQEISASFHDALVCGEGWFSVGVEFADDPLGRIVVRQEDADCMSFDPLAQRPGEWAWVCSSRELPAARVAAMFADADLEWEDVLRAAQAGVAAAAADSPSSVVVAAVKYGNEGDQAPGGKLGTGPNASVVLHRFQEAQYEEVTVATPLEADPETGKRGRPVVHKRDDWEAMPPEIKAKHRATPSTRRVIRESFIVGDRVLSSRNAATGSRFSYCMIECNTRKHKGKGRSRYGLIKKGKGVAEFQNRFVSLAIHAMAVSPKSGLIAQENAVKDWAKFERDYATVGKIAMVRDIEKIKEIKAGGLPQGVETLMNVSREWLPAATGVNLAMLGQINDLRRVSGSAVSQITQAGAAVLAKPFDSLRRARRHLGRALLEVMMEFYDADELQMMVDEELVVPPREEWPDVTSFGVEVDEAPVSPTEIDRFWDQSTATDLMGTILADPQLRPPGDVWVDLLPRAVPTSARVKWKEHAKSMAGVVRLGAELQQLQLQMQIMQTQMQIDQMQAMQQQGAQPGAVPGATGQTGQTGQTGGAE